MKDNLSWQVGVVLCLAALTGGCDKLGIGTQAPGSDGAPAEEDLQKISYMSSAESGHDKRKLYNHFEEAKTCGDFELAMRWDRPPNVSGGSFGKKVVYLTSGIPADLPKDSEIFISAKIEKGDTAPSGSAHWYLRMPDGSVVQAIEMANFWEKEEADSQTGKVVPIVQPEKAGRAFCGHGVYEGRAGKYPDQSESIPLVSMMFAMDRDQ